MKFKKPFPVPPSSSKEPSSQTYKRRARPNARRRRAARRRQPNSRVDMAGPGVVYMVQDMRQSTQSVIKKRNRPNARQRRLHRAALSSVEDMTFCSPRRVAICVASIYKNGLDSTHNEGFRFQCSVAHPRSDRYDFS